MKSNVCKIANGVQYLDAILKESDKVAVYNELNNKETLQLRLICEEMDGMLPNLIDGFEGDFWIEFEDGVCKVNASVVLDKFTADKKKKLVSISKNKKNSASVGMVGRIRSVLEDIFLDESVEDSSKGSKKSSHFSNGYVVGGNYSYLWSLDKYKKSEEHEAKGEDWDELEKSLIASVADDVIVGVKGKRAEIVIVKKFV